MSTVGDKIGLTAPTVAGSTDTWGTENNSLWTLVDEVMYAAREDRNNVVMGGGKIGWDGTNVTFTASIDIINHITAFKNSVTTAGSPVALSATGKVGYVQLSRKPGSDNNITSVTVVSSGSLPNGVADADFGTIVLCYRTADSTVIIPWAQKELLSGDHWQFGAAQTWFERIASARKPSFKSVPSDTSQVVVPASATAPACVWIDGKLYANTADKTLDLDTSGRNGLDTGAKAASTVYYLYAITPTSGRGFDVVCSTTAPSGAGPTGFTSFSYIGAFVTKAASAVAQFSSSNGFANLDDHVFSSATTTSTSAVSRTITPYPVTVKKHYGEIIILSGTAVGGTAEAMGQGTVISDALEVFMQVSGVVASAFGFVPALDGVAIWIKTTNAANTIRYDSYGWVEDPMEYK